jgi:germination protein M
MKRPAFRVAIALVAILVIACGQVPASSVPAPTASPRPIVSPSASPSATPTATPTASPTATASPTQATPTATAAPVSPSPTTSPAPTGTMVVRAYYLLDDAAGGDPALVPVLRTVPKSKGTARAAMRALLAGPTAKERGADPRIRTTIPRGTTLLGITINEGVATVDLSGAFATGGGSFSVRARLAQVVYTLTQFSTVDRVRFKLDGEPVTVFSSEGIILKSPVDRAHYRDDFLPAIFVDRPAWGASLLTPGRVTGLANVFEAQFRIALLDSSGDVLVERPVMATCGTGCWGRFDVTLPYRVSVAQWGTLRVWDPSERDGAPEHVRQYPIWLRPAAD